LHGELYVLLLLNGLQDAYNAGYGTPRGRAVIIANSDFVPVTLSRREGTDVDIRKLKHVFIGLNFEVVVYENLTSDVSCIICQELLSLSILFLVYLLLKSL